MQCRRVCRPRHHANTIERREKRECVVDPRCLRRMKDSASSDVRSSAESRVLEEERALNEPGVGVQGVTRRRDTLAFVSTPLCGILLEVSCLQPASQQGRMQFRRLTNVYWFSQKTDAPGATPASLCENSRRPAGRCRQWRERDNV